MNLVDQIADIILSRAVCEGREGEDVTAADRDTGSYWHCQEAAKRVLALVRPRIETQAELDALPISSVVVDASGIPRTKRLGSPYMAAGWTHGGCSPITSQQLADGRPMYVVYTPGDTE